MRLSRIQSASYNSRHVTMGKFRRGSGGRLVLERLQTVPYAEGRQRDMNDTVTTVFASVSPCAEFKGPVHVSIPGHVALTKTTRTPAIAKTRQRKIAEFEASQIIPYPLSDVIWDFSVLSQAESELEMMIVAAKQETIVPLCEAAEAAHLRVERIAPSCVALRDAFRFSYPEILEPVLLVSIGARSTDVILVDAIRSYTRTISIGGDLVTAAVADALALDRVAAELLKSAELQSAQSSSTEPPMLEAVETTMVSFANRLAAETAKSIATIRQHTSRTPVAVYLTGGGSLLECLTRILEERLSIPVTRFDALRRVDLSTDASTLDITAARATLGELVGLAAAGLFGEVDTGVNLMPQELRTGREFRRRQPWLIAAAAVLALSVLPPIQHFRRIAKRANFAATRIEAVVAPMRVFKQRNLETMAALDRDRVEISRLVEITRKQTSWTDFLADIQSRVSRVDGAWIQKLSVVPTGSGESEATSNPASEPRRIKLGGYLLDRNYVSSRESAETFAKVKQLLADLGQSPLIAAIESEQFDRGQNGILKFEFTVVASQSAHF